MNKKTEKQQQLDALYAPYMQCQQCPLATQGRTTVVFGRGNPDARMVIIGEAPGKQEDESGEPFVGRSGKLLTQLCNEIGITQADIFITNVVKCRPPQNRKPLPIEISTCKKILLHKQLDIIQPTIICTLGAVATQGILNQSLKITAHRGVPIEYNTMLVMPTYHPAYALRNPKERETLKKDLLNAAKIAFPNLK
jgi:uracil-DNA glycosylase family 4